MRRSRSGLTPGADSRRYLPGVLRFLASGRFDPPAVPTTTCTWDEPPQAWLQPAIKLAVTR